MPSDALYAQAAQAPQRTFVQAQSLHCAGAESFILETAGDGSVHVTQGSSRDIDASIEGSAVDILRLLTGKLRLSDARAGGLRYEGDTTLLRRFGAK